MTHRPSLSLSASCVLVLVGAVLSISCGGGGGGGTAPPPPPTPDFSIATNPSNGSLTAGQSLVITATATGQNGFNSPITLAFAGLPAGVTVSPSSVTLAVGVPQDITVSAAASAAAANATVTITATGGGLTHTGQVSLVITSPPSNKPPSRTRWVRTDASTQYFLTLNQHWIVFSSLRKQFFVTDPVGGHVYVMDAGTQSKIAGIDVPGAFGIDITPDQKTIYVGTLSGDVYSIDVTDLQVRKRYMAAQIGPYGYRACTALVLADGRLALLQTQYGIPSVDGSSSFAVWDPRDNSIEIYTSTYGSAGGNAWSGVPYKIVCGGFMGNIGGFARTADRTKVIVGSIFSDNTLCTVDPGSGRDTYITAAGSFSGTNITVTPDSKLILLRTGSNQVTAYDAETLAAKSTIPVADGLNSATGFMVSSDSKTLYIMNGSAVLAYDLSNHNFVGWVSDVIVTPTAGGLSVGPVSSAYYQAVDDTGLLAGPLQEGVTFLDVAHLNAPPVGTVFANAYVKPATGPASGGTPVNIDRPANAAPISSLYFGNQKASAAALNGNFISATSPAGNAGPADVSIAYGDGAWQIIPEAFSYGPTIMQVTPDASTVEGGGVGFIYGYGFLPFTVPVTIPSDLQVRVGSTAATIVGVSQNSYGVLSQPFLLQTIVYTVPPGALGKADVTVVTSSGSATSAGGMTYLPPLETFPNKHASVAQGVYDKYRDLYYFTDINRIQVFSPGQRAWLGPIGIAAPVGATQRLWGIALSPDGSKLAISDLGAGVIYVMDPDLPASARTFSIINQTFGVKSYPAGLAISDSGVVYYTVSVDSGTGYTHFFKLDTNTNTIKDYQIQGADANALALHTAISADNTRVYFNNQGAVFAVDTATDKVFWGVDGPGCCYGDFDLTLAPNQIQFAATSYIYDADLNSQSFLTGNPREFFDVGYLLGIKFSTDGSLLFQPTDIGIDVLDGHLGRLRNRISLPVPLAPTFDALVSNGKDNKLVAITGQGDGIAFIDLNSIPEPPPLPYATPTAPAHSLPPPAGNSRREQKPSLRRSSTAQPSQPLTRRIRHVTIRPQ